MQFTLKTNNTQTYTMTYKNRDNQKAHTLL